MTTANAIVADLTKHEDRARFLGYVSTAISAGLVAGPMIGETDEMLRKNIVQLHESGVLPIEVWTYGVNNSL